MAIENVSFEPDWFSPPGASIQAAMARKKLSIGELALDLDLGLNETRSLLLGDKFIDDVLAQNLAQSLGGSIQFWLNRQKDFTESLQRCAEQSGSEIHAITQSIPLTELRKLGWVADNLKPPAQALAFLDVRSVEGWKKRYEERASAVMFRQSMSLQSDAISTLAWLRQAERLASLIHCKQWNKATFSDSLYELRSFTKRKSPGKFFPELVKKCSEHGVAVVFVPPPKGCRASGATFFLNDNKAVMVLSFRFLSDDQFWFSFFHEAAHLVLHDRRALFLEDSDEVTLEAEKEANQFASELLVPTEYRPELESLPARTSAIVRFAVRLGISPGVVVGQMQHAGLIGHGQMNGLKRRFSREDLAKAL